MQIFLMCSSTSGQAAFLAETVEGIPAPQRHYDIIGGQVILAGYPDVILHHDADELLKQSIYRMPTPLEQEQMTQAQIQASTAQESAPVDNPDGSEQTGVTPTDPDAPEPPAQEKQKKANGG